MLPSTSSRVLTLMVGGAGLVVTAACSGATSHPRSVAPLVAVTPSAGATTATPTPAGPTPSSSGPSAGGTASASEPAGTGCRTSELAAHLTSTGSGAGSSFLTLTLTDRGMRSCVLTGYPGISYVAGADAHQVGAAAVRSSGSPESAVQLSPGTSGVAMIRSGNPNVYPPEQCRPVAVRGMRVYPPGSTVPLVLDLPAGTQACSASALPGGPELEVGPVQRP